MTATPAPKANPIHKQAGIQALISASSSGVTLASLLVFGNATFPAQTAAVTTGVLTALTFLRKESPYLRDLMILWRAVRKNKKVSHKTASLLANPIVQQAIAEAVAASKEVPAVSEAASAVEEAVTAPAPIKSNGPLSGLGL